MENNRHSFRCTKCKYAGVCSSCAVRAEKTAKTLERHLSRRLPLPQKQQSGQLVRLAVHLMQEDNVHGLCGGGGEGRRWAPWLDGEERR